MSWEPSVEKVIPFVVKIETQEGEGTGFLCFLNGPKTMYGIATAQHVIASANRWQQPIRIIHEPSKKVAFLPENQRYIFADESKDSAVVLVPAEMLELPKQLIPLLPTESRLPVGSDVGWLGYPGGGRPGTLCFFSGCVSAWDEERNAYLIDGVAIPGVSGGPVFYNTSADGVHLVGAITAYISNRSGADTLVGLSIAQDLSHFHDVISYIKSVDDARASQPPTPKPAIDGTTETAQPDAPQLSNAASG